MAASTHPGGHRRWAMCRSPRVPEEEIGRAGILPRFAHCRDVPSAHAWHNSSLPHIETGWMRRRITWTEIMLAAFCPHRATPQLGCFCFTWAQEALAFCILAVPYSVVRVAGSVCHPMLGTGGGQVLELRVWPTDLGASLFAWTHRVRRCGWLHSIFMDRSCSRPMLALAGRVRIAHGVP
jgi:hypothetical protein